MPRITQLNVNGAARTIDADPDWSLLSVLRDQLDLTGSKYGCGEGQCGACTVLIDGNPRRSCITHVGSAANRKITTIEGLEQNGKLHPLQEAFLAEDAMQCAYCTSGMIMTGSGAAANKSESFGTGSFKIHGRKHLPVRNAAADCCRRSQSRKRFEGVQPMTPKLIIDSLLQSGTARQPDAPEASAFIIEPERYELTAAPTYYFELHRREFFKFLGAGILVFCVLKDASAAQESGRAAAAPGQFGEPLPKDIGAWLHIGENGIVTVYTGKVEIGQNIRTSLSQAVSEELHVSVNQIEMVMGDTQLTPFDLGTFGSRSTPTMNLQLRKVSAAARGMLVDLAAQHWQVDRQRLVASAGKINDPQAKRSVTYAELVQGKQLTQSIPVEDPLTPAAEWTVAGQRVAKIDARDFVTGKHRYPSDQKLPGMIYGKIVRADSFNAALVSADTTEAAKIPGVVVVRDGDFIGVTAADEATATRAAAAVKAQWKSDPQPSNNNLFEYLKNNPFEANATGGNNRYEVGSVEQALASAAHRLEQTYTVQYIAHVPLEPRAALAQWDGDKLTVWTGTQRPFGVRGELAQAFHIPEDASARVDAGHGFWLRRQTHRRVRDRSRAARARGQETSKTCLDTRRRIYLGLFPSGGSDRNKKRRASRRHDHRLGIPQLQFRRSRDSHLLRDSQPAHRISSDEGAPAPGFVSRARCHSQSVRPRIPHGRTC